MEFIGADLEVEVGEDGQGHQPDAGHRLHQGHLRLHQASWNDCRWCELTKQIIIAFRQSRQWRDLDFEEVVCTAPG